MLDPRIYRMGFVAVALAVVVVAFSLQNQRGPLTSTLAPDAFSGQSAFTAMNALAAANPQRRPGSPGDDDVATTVATRLRRYGYRVSTEVSVVRTAEGKRQLETVLGTRAGLAPGAIVILSHRDALSSPAAADLSGTAAMLELARALAGETQHHTIVLASVSGSAGAAGAGALARSLPGPVDGVIALGDLAGVQPRDLIVIPWSDRDRVAPPELRNTVAAALGAQAQLRPGGAGVLGQLSHLALPLSLGEQAPFGDRGIPAVTVSMAGDHRPPGQERVSADSLTGLGRTVLAAVDGLDTGTALLPRPSGYLVFSGKLVPGWAIRLLGLALILPVALVAIDGLARVRRRCYHPGRGLLRALIHALPFAAAAAVVILARVLGVLPAAPRGPLAGGEVALGGAGVALLVLVGVVLAGGLALARWLHPGGLGGTSLAEPAPDPGHAAGTLALLCLTCLALWLVNPFAVLFALPALHAWLWLLDPELRPPLAVALALGGVGLAGPAFLVVELARALSLTPPQVVWNGLLLIAGGALGPALVACLAAGAGCLVSVAAISLRVQRQPRIDQAPVTVRGPVTYAGPGSLGGTESALRR